MLLGKVEEKSVMGKGVIQRNPEAYREIGPIR